MSAPPVDAASARVTFRATGSVGIRPVLDLFRAPPTVHVDLDV